MSKVDWEARREWCLDHAVFGIQQPGTAKQEAEQLRESVPETHSKTPGPPSWAEVDAAIAEREAGRA